MSLSAIDCVSRGVANLRANWELVLLQLAQLVACTVLTVVGAIGIIAVLGASFLFQMNSLDDWPAMLERIEGFSVNWGLVAIGLAGLLILGTIIALVYSWFQAGILTTLERGERQAPPSRGVDWQLFRTYSGRYFAGWSRRWTWRYFGFFNWALLVMTVFLAVVAFAVALLVAAMGPGDGTGMMALGCLAMVPLLGLMLGLNLWILLTMALLPREELGVFRASRVALGILWRRLGGALLIVLLFVIASFAIGIVFVPLTQGLAVVLSDKVAALLAVQLLLTAAQWMLSSILTVALLGSVVALARTEIDARTI